MPIIDTNVQFRTLKCDSQRSKDQKAADVKIIETSFRVNKALFLDRFYNILYYGGPQE